MSLRFTLVASLMACHLAACQPAQRTEAEKDEADEQENDAPALSIAEPPLDRRNLLLALGEAASASAIGEDDRQPQRELDGKRFELRLRFGCGSKGTAASIERRGWTFDEDSRILRFHVEPEVDVETPLVRSITPAGFEAVEGFWMRRPWLLRDGCPATLPANAAGGQGAAPEPAAEANATELAQPEPRIAIAQFYTTADPRTHRRDSRAYQATRTLDAGEAPSASGYNLVLSGRLRALPGGRVIACAPAIAEAPPACIVSAAFDQVAIEVPDSRKIVAQWAAG